jgi:hypothetical protein
VDPVPDPLLLRKSDHRKMLQMVPGIKLLKIYLQVYHCMKNRGQEIQRALSYTCAMLSVVRIESLVNTAWRVLGLRMKETASRYGG